MKYVAEFLSYLENVKNRSEKTVLAYQSDLAEFERCVNKENLCEIKKQDIENKYISYLVEKGNSASSRARKLSALRSFFDWAKIQGYIVENPVESVEMPKIPHKEVKVMTNEEVKKVIECAFKDKSRESDLERFRNIALLSLMFSTGVRRAELTNIKLSHLDLNESALLVNGKGNKQRVVYFNDTTKAILSEYVASHRNNFATAKTSEYLFVTKRAKKMEVSTVNKLVNKYFEMAGVKEKGYTVHSTRKVFATNIYRNTNDLITTQALLGHSNPQTTLRYVGASEAIKRKAAMTISF